MADQLTSLALMLTQLQYLVCFYLVDVWQPATQDTCFTSQPMFSPYLVLSQPIDFSNYSFFEALLTSILDRITRCMAVFAMPPQIP